MTGGLGGAREGGTGEAGTVASIAQSLVVLILTYVSKGIINIFTQSFEAPQPVFHFSRVASVTEVEVESETRWALNNEITRSGCSGGTSRSSLFTLL